jgi:hypothetical protein
MPHPNEGTPSLKALFAERRTGRPQTPVLGANGGRTPLQASPRALQVQPGRPYNEQVFRWLLSVEHRRSERSSRPFFLLLVDLKRRGGDPPRIDQVTADKLVVALRSGLRRTDAVGWYRQERVVGALLAEPRTMPGADVSEAVGRRVAEVLDANLAPERARQFRLRIHRYPEDTGDTTPQRMDLTHRAVRETS